MFESTKKRPGHLYAIERLKTWTRERFLLPEGTAIFAAELVCALPGCPPLETVISFWDAAGTRYHFKIFKPASEIVMMDLPYRWLMDALAVPEGFECDCC
ncbi:MAG: hypothetical protein ACKVQK_18920 [Burkholderiales bacterium]